MAKTKIAIMDDSIQEESKPVKENGKTVYKGELSLSEEDVLAQVEQFKKQDQKPKEKPAEKPREKPKEPSDYVGKEINVSQYNSNPDIKKIAEQGKKLIDTFGNYTKRVLTDYTLSDYGPLNEAARKCPPNFECLEGKTKLKFEKIEEAISKSKFSEPLTVFRGVYLVGADKEAFIQTMKQAAETGKPIQMPCISSTSMRPDIANWFTSTSNTMFQIRTKTGLPVDAISENQGEAEILLSTKTKYRVVSVSEADYLDESPDRPEKSKKQIVYLEEVEDGIK
jgi:hypothetical protein